MSIDEIIRKHIEENGLTESVILAEEDSYEIVLTPKNYLHTSINTIADPQPPAAYCKSAIRADDYLTWLCTRADGHDGPHVAGHGQNIIYCVW